MIKPRHKLWSAFGGAVLAVASAPLQAATLKAEYVISLIGLPLATATVVSSIEGTTYKTDVQARTTGLAGVVASGKGAATATGSLAGGQPLPASFVLTSRSSKGPQNIRMGLAQGNVAQVDIVPPLEPKPDRVPLVDAHKRGVVDPVSALLLPVHGKGDLISPANCNRTIPVFDGASRFDVVLSFAESRKAEMAGYRGPVIVCNVRYVPLSGHRPERPGTKFMMENRDISVWLAPVEGTRLLAPVRISLMTMLGTSVAEATRFAVDRAPAPGQ
jgi:Protein of unknown function (DUF3108)